MDGMGVNITIMSYRGVLYWGVIACPEVMPRIWDLADAVPGALDELIAAAGIEPASRVGVLDGHAGVGAPGATVGPPGGTAQGAEATAMDEAPEQTATGLPKDPVSG